MTLTVAMITLNEEKNLERTLKSVQDFADEIVIVDSGSTDKTIKHGGWSNTYRIRLFRKNSGSYNENSVHEEFATSQEIAKIHSYIYHHSYSDLADYFKKFNKYTTLGAIEYYKKSKKAHLISIVLSPIYKFLRMYIIRLGFLDGLEGFLLATTSSLYTMVKYYKLREIYKNGSYIEGEEKNGN